MPLLSLQPLDDIAISGGNGQLTLEENLACLLLWNQSPDAQNMTLIRPTGRTRHSLPEPHCTEPSSPDFVACSSSVNEDHKFQNKNPITEKGRKPSPDMPQALAPFAKQSRMCEFQTAVASTKQGDGYSFFTPKLSYSRDPRTHSETCLNS